MTLRAVWYGCWFSHGETHWTRDRLECQRCGSIIDVLPQVIVRGPAHVPEPVRGQPLQQAKVKRSDNRIEFPERVSQKG